MSSSTYAPGPIAAAHLRGCWRTLQGLTDFAIAQSYLDTATKWGLDKLDALRQLFTTTATNWCTCARRRCCSRCTDRGQAAVPPQPRRLAATPLPTDAVATSRVDPHPAKASRAVCGHRARPPLARRRCRPELRDPRPEVRGGALNRPTRVGVSTEKEMT
jgi:hypothetical protein